jgi:hypothetical protein
MKDVKITKYWRTEPVDKECSGMWSGYHESEEDAIKYIMASIRGGGIFAFFAEDFEVLPYYVIEKD